MFSDLQCFENSIFLILTTNWKIFKKKKKISHPTSIFTWSRIFKFWIFPKLVFFLLTFHNFYLWGRTLFCTEFLAKTRAKSLVFSYIRLKIYEILTWKDNLPLFFTHDKMLLKVFFFSWNNEQNRLFFQCKSKCISIKNHNYFYFIFQNILQFKKISLNIHCFCKSKIKILGIEFLWKNPKMN